MPTPRDAATAHRREKHLALVGGAATATARLWRACNWLISTAAHHQRLTEVLEIVRDLIDRLDTGQPLRPAIEPEPTPPPDGPQTPWYLQVRATPGDRRDSVA